MSERNTKAEGLFDLALDYMSGRLKDGDLERGELKTILEFLDRQGINCVGQKNPKVKGMLHSLPARVAAENSIKEAM